MSNNYPKCGDCRWHRYFYGRSTCYHPKVPRSPVNGEPEHFASNPFGLRSILFFNWLRCGPWGAWFEPRDSS